MEFVVIGVIGQAVALVALVALASQGPGELLAVRIRSDGGEEQAETEGPDAHRVRLVQRWLAAFLVATAVATAGASGL